MEHTITEISSESSHIPAFPYAADDAHLSLPDVRATTRNVQAHMARMFPPLSSIEPVNTAAEMSVAGGPITAFPHAADDAPITEPSAAAMSPAATYSPTLSYVAIDTCLTEANMRRIGIAVQTALEQVLPPSIGYTRTTNATNGHYRTGPSLPDTLSPRDKFIQMQRLQAQKGALLRRFRRLRRGRHRLHSTSPYPAPHGPPDVPAAGMNARFKYASRLLQRFIWETEARFAAYKRAADAKAAEDRAAEARIAQVRAALRERTRGMRDVRARGLRLQAEIDKVWQKTRDKEVNAAYWEKLMGALGKGEKQRADV